jgi:phosphodiesterase/alkaline phosphatase D-like protein
VVFSIKLIRLLWVYLKAGANQEFKEVTLKRVNRLAFLIVILSVSYSSATTYHISKSGNDSRDGRSWSNAWLTVGHLNDGTFLGGDTVYFGRGDYYLAPATEMSVPSNETSQWTAYLDSSFMVGGSGMARLMGAAPVSTSGWDRYGTSNVYARYFPEQNGADVGICGQNDSMLFLISSAGSTSGYDLADVISYEGFAYWDDANDSLYVHCRDLGLGYNPANYTIDIGYCDVNDLVAHFRLYRYSHRVVWKGLEFNYCRGYGIMIAGNSNIMPDNIQVVHCDFQNGWSFQALNSGNNPGYIRTALANTQDQSCDNLLIRGCTFDSYITADYPFADDRLRGSRGTILGAWYGNRGTVIDSCLFYGASECVIHWKNQSGHDLALNNTVRYCTFKPIWTDLYIQMENCQQNDSVYGNVFWGGLSPTTSNCYEYGIRFKGTQSPEPDNGTSHYVMNNTFYNVGKSSAVPACGVSSQTIDPAYKVTAKYNIFYSEGTQNLMRLDTGARDSLISDSNMFYSTSADKFWSGSALDSAEWINLGYGYDAHSTMSVNPGFSNADGVDFSRPSAPQEMNLTYGGQTWTRYGAWQPPSGPDVTPPVISNVRSTDTTSNSVTIRWSTNEGATSRVEYGLTTSYGSFTPLDPTLVWSHAQAIAGLSPTTTYHYRVLSRDAAGNEAVSVDYTFRTLTPDTNPPTINGVGAQNITPSSATIVWATNELATSQVNYGLTTSYGSTTTLDPTLELTHDVGLSGLTADTLYHYRVRSRDAAGNEAVSGDYTFRTLTPDTTPPTISAVVAGNITATSATITWTTNELATSQVNYGLTNSYGSTTFLDPALLLNHGVGITGLTPDTLYHYRVRSSDAAGNEAVSSDFTFNTDTVMTMQLISLDVPVSVCGNYSGYNPIRINDGVVNPRGGTSTTWASDSDSTSPHWIEFTFSAIRQVSRARVLWALNGSNWMCSQQYIIQHWDANSGSYVNTATVNNSSPDSITITDFTPVTTNRIRYWQPANMGPVTYRRITWLTELELYGTNAGQDTIPPDPIDDLGAAPADVEGYIDLQWTAPSAIDGPQQADHYDIRYSTGSINESNWTQATAVSNPPVPNVGGVGELFTVTGLSAGTIFNLAIKSYDNVGNESPLSNVISSYSAGISPPIALDTRVDSSTATAVLVGAAMSSYLSVFYEFALDTTEAFSNARMEVSLLADSTVTCFFDSLSAEGHYYWRFRAVASDRSFTSDWSNVLNFDYFSGNGPALTSADCLFPTEGTTVQSSSPTFLVRSVPNVAYVYIQVADNTGFSSPTESGPLSAGSGDVAWKISQPLLQGPVYYWRVSADNIMWTAPIAFGAEIDIHPYPNPFRASEGVPGVTFVNLPGNSKVTIATVSGSVVREAEGIGPDEWIWDVKNNGGGELASGVYLYRVDYPDGSSSGKVMVIR